MRLMCTCERTVYRYVERFRVTGDVRQSLSKNGPQRVLSEHEELYMIDLVLSSPGIYLKEVQQRLFNYTGRWIHASTICRTLWRLGMTRTTYSPAKV